LNDGPLTAEQTKEANSFLNQVTYDLKNSKANETDIFKRDAAPFDKYNPDEAPWAGVFSKEAFEKLPLTDLPYKVELPTCEDVQSLARKIQKGYAGLPLQ
jgi:hypothetical protein